MLKIFLLNWYNFVPLYSWCSVLYNIKTFIKTNVDLPLLSSTRRKAIGEENNYNLGKVIFINNLKLFNDFSILSYQALLSGIKHEAAETPCSALLG